MTALHLQQLAFELPIDPLYRWENYFISPCNEQVVTWVRHWPQWPTRGGIILGPKASGKTHLCHLWRLESQATFLDRTTFSYGPALEKIRSHPYLIVDNAAQGWDAKSLFSLYNLTHEFQGFLLLTAQTPPQQWGLTLPDCLSRLQTFPQLTIQPPDDELLKAMLIKRFADRQLKVPQAVTDYLWLHIPRTYEAIDALATALDQASMAMKRSLTIPFAKQICAQLWNI